MHVYASVSMQGFVRSESKSNWKNTTKHRVRTNLNCLSSLLRVHTPAHTHSNIYTRVKADYQLACYRTNGCHLYLQLHTQLQSNPQREAINLQLHTHKASSHSGKAQRPSTPPTTVHIRGSGKGPERVAAHHATDTESGLILFKAQNGGILPQSS